MCIGLGEMSELSDYQRGLAEGARDALLGEHTQRLNKINGSVERHAKSVEALTRETRSGFEKLASEIRTMQEDARLDRERVKVAAQTLAAETERRREALADRGGTWSLRANKATVVSVAAAVLFGVVSLYLALH